MATRAPTGTASGSGPPPATTPPTAPPAVGAPVPTPPTAPIRAPRKTAKRAAAPRKPATKVAATRRKPAKKVAAPRSRSRKRTAADDGDGWEELASQGLGFLRSLAATVTPTQEQTAVADYYLAVRGALGRSLPNKLSLTLDTKGNTVSVADPPDGAIRYQLGNFGYNGKRKGGRFGSNTIQLGTFDYTSRPLIVLLYDANNLLLGRGSIE